MNFGISTACFYPLQTEIAVKYLAEMNVKTIEIFFNSYSELKQQIVGEIKARAKGNNINIVAVHPFNSVFEPFLFFSDYTRRYEDILDVYKEYFDVMNVLGAKIFIFHGDKADSGIENNLYFERFNHLCEIANNVGITVAQENVARCKSKSNEFLLEMKRQLPQTKFVFDIKQAVRSKNDPFKTLEIMGENVVHIHASDNNEKYDCLEIGKGDFDFIKLFSFLKSIDYKNNIMLELYKENYNNYLDLLLSIENLDKNFKLC